MKHSDIPFTDQLLAKARKIKEGTYISVSFSANSTVNHSSKMPIELLIIPEKAMDFVCRFLDDGSLLQVRMVRPWEDFLFVSN